MSVGQLGSGDDQEGGSLFIFSEAGIYGHS